MDSPSINRRALLRLLALGSAAAATPPSWVARLTEVALAQAAGTARAPRTDWAPALLTPHQDRTVTAVAELIIPQTETAGAKAAGVNQFIDTVIADADASERDRFLQGLDWIDVRARELHGTDFVSTTPAQQTALLASISAAAAGAPSIGVEFFKSFKALTITGYYTSRIGMREELGDDGRTAFPDYAGCTHPEHEVSA